MENSQLKTKQNVELTTGKTPTVLIQDVLNGRSYLLDGDDLEKYVMTKDKLSEIGYDTVTFVIPEENKLLDLTPPFTQIPSNNPSVIIQHHSQKKAYFITSNQLINHLIPQPESLGDGYDFSFILPHGTELIEELPEMMKGLLQSGEGTARF